MCNCILCLEVERFRCIYREQSVFKNNCQNKFEIAVSVKDIVKFCKKRIFRELCKKGINLL